MLIGGKWVDPASGEWFESVNPFTAKPWALIPRGGKADVDRAVAAAKARSTGEWRKLTATARGALLYRLADLIAAEAGQARRDRDHRQRQADRRNARPAELHPAMVSLFRRPGRQNRRPRDSHRQAGRVQFHARRAAGRGRRDYALEFAAAAGGLETRARAGCGQHGGVEAVGIFVRFGARIRRAVRARGLSAGRGQHRHRIRQRSRRAADHASGRRQGCVHRRRSGPASTSINWRRAASSP